MLLAGLTIPGTTTVSESGEAPDHAERLLRSFGAHVASSIDRAGIHTVELDGLPNLRAQRVEVPGDPSLAAFGMVAALIVPGSEVIIEQVSVNPTRSGLLGLLLEMGGDIEVLSPRLAGGEEIADLRVRHSTLRSIAVPAAAGPSIAAEYAILAVAAAFAEGESRFEGLDLLPAAERQRLLAVGQGLRANRVACELGPDSMTVGGGRVPGGGRVITGHDHWLALGFLVLGMAADDQVTIDDQSAIDEHFPGFISSFEEIGASFIRYTE
jgi:3-phosphoshikimate 1-carboxyvinyltransferase